MTDQIAVPVRFSGYIHPHLTEDAAALHAHEQHAAIAHGIGA